MKISLHFLLMMISSITYVHATEPSSSNLNLTISEVKTFRIDRRLVRTILYNRINPPYFEIELIKAPKRALLKKIAVNSITSEYEKRLITMDFFKSAGVDIENIRTDKTAILFEVGYTAAEHTAPRVYSTCRVDVNGDKFSIPVCRILKWGNDEISSPSP